MTSLPDSSSPTSAEWRVRHGTDSAPRAPVFNLVNGSFVDGPGIRTTIFLKGCRLRCKWCCNPEGQSFQPEMRFLAAHCRSGCSDCVSACPEGAIRQDTGTLKIDRAKCIGCGRCETACFEDALRLFGKWYTPEDVMGRIRREKPYLTRSGGGVTIGGGEATCWSAFCRELIRLCHAEGIHTAIDSCGYPCTEETLAALDAADLVLFDLKGMDSARHQENTGAGNEEILRTFEHLRTTNKPVIVRAPLVRIITTARAGCTGAAAARKPQRRTGRPDALSRIRRLQIRGDRPCLSAGRKGGTLLSGSGTTAAGVFPHLSPKRADRRVKVRTRSILLSNIQRTKDCPTVVGTLSTDNSS